MRVWSGHLLSLSGRISSFQMFPHRGTWNESRICLNPVVCWVSSGTPTSSSGSGDVGRVSSVPEDYGPWELTPSLKRLCVCGCACLETPIAEFLIRPCDGPCSRNVVFHWLLCTLTSSWEPRPGIRANLERKTNWSVNGSLGKLCFPVLTGTVQLGRVPWRNNDRERWRKP